MKILINYYHPVCEDLCETFSNLGHEVFLSVNTSVDDHYGSWVDLYEKLKSNPQYKVLTLDKAKIFVKSKMFDLVGVDGVFSGDDDLINICRGSLVKYFCIQGYPMKADEPSENILSLGWFLPQVQYMAVNKQSEQSVKNIDWKNIHELGQSKGKNVHVFYPNFWKIKNLRLDDANDHDPKKLVSLVQRYEQYNYYSHLIFEDVKSEMSGELSISNLESVSHEKTIEELQTSAALLHLKFADQPGIAIFEAMLLAKPVITMRSFVLASFNQEVLIDGYNAIVADTVTELKDRIRAGNFESLGLNAYRHAAMLTSYDRQKDKLELFLNSCV